MITQTRYDSPKVEIVELNVEAGFAESLSANSIDDWKSDMDSIDF